MHDAARLAGLLVDLNDQALTMEFEARLADSSALAFRVAYSVLRDRQDAEDVAQEAFARAFRRFHMLRDRDRFRAKPLRNEYVGCQSAKKQHDPVDIFWQQRKGSQHQECPGGVNNVDFVVGRLSGKQG